MTLLMALERLKKRSELNALNAKASLMVEGLTPVDREAIHQDLQNALLMSAMAALAIAAYHEGRSHIG